jgi:hypothetical protein
VTRPKGGKPKKEIARSAGGLKVCGKICFMDQSEIFLYSLKPSALNYDWPPKFLVAKENKSRIFFRFETSNFPFENARRFHPFFVLSFFFRSKNLESKEMIT